LDIYLIEIPATDGKEQSGYRPGIIISNPTKDIAIIIPFTSNILALRFPFTLKIEPNPQNGLSVPSILLIFQIRAIDKTRIKNKLGKLDENSIISIKTTLKLLLNL
jgi:mRNA interferase MazF